MKFISKYGNKLGERLIVHSGVSDLKVEGYFTSENFVREDTGKEITTPLMFYFTEQDALKDLPLVAESYGYSEKLELINA